MRLAGRVVMVLAAVVLLLAAALLFRLWRSIPPLAGREAVEGLSGPVTVTWDSLAVPHIAAPSDADAFRALGYLHARDRLWQMELLRRAAEGRLSEILGPAAVSTDRFLRSLDIVRAAEASLALAPDSARAILDAYVGGVNAWIAHPTRPLGPEFLLLRFRPEPWTARQSVEVGRIMAWDLVNAQVELNLATAQARVGPQRIRDLMPWVPDGGATIIQPGEGTWRAGARARGRAARAAYAAQGGSGQPGSVPSVRLATSEVPVIPALAAEILDASSMRRASNSWVIGPRRTKSGKPILANDPHLRLRAPALWYLATIASPGYSVSGATLPGLPPVVIGHNRRIAWGLTNMEADDVDYVIERLSPDSSRVQTPGGWVPVEVERDSIRVKGRPAVPFTLRRTPDGPIVDARAAGPRTDSGGTLRVLAMRWNAHTPSDELSALLAVNRAGSWDALLAALRGFRAPEQNWVYADVDGNIGYTASGAIPVRRSGTGLLPTPGWTGEGRWERFLDFEELPRVLNPAEGFIVTANNRIAGPEYPWTIASNPALPYRAERIRELILAGHAFTADDVQRMQMDTVDGFARRAKSLAAAAAAAAGRADLAAALRAWDGAMGSDRTEPAVFWLWYRALQRLTFEDDVAYTPGGPFQRALRAGASSWFDDTRTPEREDLAALSLRAMREALPQAEGRRWGDLHRTLSGHALGGVAVLDRMLRLSIGPAPRAGSPYTVDVADFGMRPPFINTHAASYRQVVDLADPERARLIISTGQSGHPLARRYRDQVGRWWRGELWMVSLSDVPVAGAAVLTLAPPPR